MSADFDFDDSPPVVRRATYARAGPATNHPASNSLGIASLVVGGVSLMVGIVPLFGAVAFLSGAVGVCLGALAVVVSLVRGGRGIGYGIGGLSLSLCACLVSGWLTWVIVSPTIDRAVERSKHQPNPAGHP